MKASRKRRFPLGNSFGVMQGRLSQQTERGYQSFPWESWEEEFETAAELGLEHIEWVLDSFDIDVNPLMVNPAIVNKNSSHSGISIPSVCADFLMNTPLVSSEKEVWERFSFMLAGMEEVGAQIAVIPCVDQSSILVPANYANLVASLPKALQLASDHSVQLALEADLPPNYFLSLLTEFEAEGLKVNYDSGNSSSLGYDFDTEVRTYGHLISDFHLKDRPFGGGSVRLGDGGADFPSIIRYLKESEFHGVITVQAMRDPEGLGVLKSQLDWLETISAQGIQIG